jgi:ribosomal protein L30/L7E
MTGTTETKMEHDRNKVVEHDRNKVVEHDRNDSYLGLIQTVHLN